MKKLRGKTLGIDQGEEQLFSDYDTGGDMWVSSGPRERRKRVKFSEITLAHLRSMCPCHSGTSATARTCARI